MRCGLNRHRQLRTKRANFRVLWLIALCGVFACEDSPSTSPSADMEASRLVGVRVERVRDGDSFLASHLGSTFDVRLFGIDAPERQQPHARDSRIMAETLLLGKRVELQIKDTDRYGRVVAEVFTSDSALSVNQQLVEQGAAWVYRRYTQREDLLNSEAQAASARRGLWSLPIEERVEPWKWRKKPK